MNNVFVYQCFSELHQIEFIKKTISNNFFNKNIFIAVQCLKSKRMIYEYLKKDFNVYVAEENCLSNSSESIFFTLILKFAQNNWRSADLLAFLKTGYGFLKNEIFIDFLENKVLANKASVCEYVFLNKFVNECGFECPDGFIEFIGHLSSVLMDIKTSFFKKNMPVSYFWKKHLYIASCINNSEDWYKDNLNFVKFTERCETQFDIDYLIDFDEYVSLFGDMINTEFINQYKNQNIMISSMSNVLFFKSDVIFIFNFSNAFFKNAGYPCLIDKQILSEIDFKINYIYQDLEYFIYAISRCVNVFITHNDSATLSDWIAGIGEVENILVEQNISKKIIPCNDDEFFVPKNLRPTNLSVTKMHSLINNPYGFYVEHILELNDSKKIDCDIDDINVGTLMHNLIDFFLKNSIDDYSVFVEKFFVKAICEKFCMHLSYEEEMAIVLPRVKKMFIDFVERHKVRLLSCKNIFSEVAGSIDFAINDAVVTVKARCDRIEVFEDGSIGIFDYKTGSLSSKSDVVSGYDLQLSVSALIALSGGFKCIGSVSNVSCLAYWDLRNNDIKIMLELHDDDFFDTIYNHIKKLLTSYMNDNNDFFVMPKSNRRFVIDMHDHLCRINERSV